MTDFEVPNVLKETDKDSDVEFVMPDVLAEDHDG